MHCDQPTKYFQLNYFELGELTEPTVHAEKPPCIEHATIFRQMALNLSQ